MIRIRFTITLFILLTVIPAHADINDGLLGHWSFDEGQGISVNDQTMNHNHGELKNFSNDNSAWIKVNEQNNGVLKFNGLNQYVSIKDSTSLRFGTGDYTVSVWFQTPFTDSNYYSGLVVKGLNTVGVANTWGITKYSNINNRIKFNDTNPDRSANVSFNSEVLSDGWHNFVVTRKGNIYTFYMDNAATVMTAKATTNLTDTSELRIGRDQGSRYLGSIMDEVRLYNRVLSAQEINKHYLEHSLALKEEAPQSNLPYWVSPMGESGWANCKSATPLEGKSACSLVTANKNATAGNLVYLRGGEYVISSPTWAGIEPSNSGTDIQNRIVFKAYNNEKPILMKGSGYDVSGLFIDGKSFIKIEGLTFKNFTRWGTIRNFSHHNEISNNVFMGDTGEEGFQGLWILGMCAGTSAVHNCPATHNWIHHNTFSKMHGYPANQSCYEGADLVRIGLSYREGNTSDDNYNTVEHNILEYAGHALFDNYGMYTVFRNNIMHNEPWIPDFSSGQCYHKPEYANAAYNGKYGHRNFQITEDYGRSATYVLVEGNRAGYASLNPNNPGATNFELAAPRNIVRFNAFYGAMRFGLYFKYGTNGRLGAGGMGSTDNRVYNNTIFHSGFGHTWPANVDDGNGIKVVSNTLMNVIKNNIVYDSRQKDIFNPNNVAIEMNNWTTLNGSPKFVNPDISDPKNLVLPDLKLQGDSPVIDKATHLTQTKEGGTNSITLMVQDALYFQDGSWGSDLAREAGAFQADWIAIGTPHKIVQISHIDYDSNTITLKSPMTWSQGDPIWLFKDSSGRQVFYGKAPDMGAHEYEGSINDIPKVSKVVNAASCLQSDLQVAIDTAQAGDMVRVPAGDCSWDNNLVIKKGILLMGAGMDATFIRAGNIPKDSNGRIQPIIRYVPDNDDLNTPFRISGFTFDLNNSNLGLSLGQGKNAPFTVQTKIRVDHNRFTDSVLFQAIWNYGGMYGVIDNNIFDGVSYPIRNSVQNQNSSWWDHFSYTFGKADDNLYFEDNTFVNVGDVVADCQYSGRYAFRYNTVNTTSSMFYGWDLHGNWPYARCSNNSDQSCNVDSDCNGGTCSVNVGSNMWSCFGSEIYGNQINTTANTQGVQIYAARGGKSLIFNNNVNTQRSAWIKTWDDWCNEANPTTNQETQDVHDTYFFGNRVNKSGALTKTVVNWDRSYCLNNLKTDRPKQNRDFFVQEASFDGSTGVGCGPLASRPTSCTPGVGYWATNQNCNDLSGQNGKNPSNPISGTLYQCTSPNTWIAYYTPYTYPHPLRSDCVNYSGMCDTKELIDDQKNVGLGDVSGDSKITMYDAALVWRYTLGSILSDAQKQKADMNADGKIDGSDVLAIGRKALGL